MKAVILAAGEGLRMRPLTESTPKQLLRVHGKTLLEYVLETLPSDISEIVMVIGYKGEQIQKFLGNIWREKPVTYVWQEKKEGTARALSLCKDVLKDETLFMTVYADDIHGAAGVAACIARQQPCLLLSKVEDPRRFGVVEIDMEGRITGIVEKPDDPKSNFVSNGVLVLPADILNYATPLRDNGEEYISDRIAKMIADGHEFYTAHATFWHPIGYPEDLQKAEEILAKQIA